MSDDFKVSNSPKVNADNNFKVKFNKNVEKLNNNSIFKLLENADSKKNEIAFLMTVFDKDGDGQITDNEINSVKIEEFYNEKEECNKMLKDNKLVLSDFSKTTAELKRRIRVTSDLSDDEKESKGFLSASLTAQTAEADQNFQESYTNHLINIKLLEKEQNLTEEQNLSLNESKKMIKLLNIALSPEAREEITNKVEEDYKKYIQSTQSDQNK